ncbi:peptidoglycan bridge formation glycyltransferase FemA/FemB family protein [Candidatus Falkowbacteria bacterium]|nr:peptidoglycan bridge formation glycyltransferase FemA/FemB family protein [Candidatus Falkowbacteria bacterium]
MLITDQKLWDEFIIANGNEFLQSWDWGVLQQTLGRTIWRFGVMEGNALCAAALVIKMPLPFGQHYLYSPRGPIWRGEPAQEKLFAEIIDLARQKYSLFYRLEPLTDLGTRDYGLRTTTPRQPAQTMVINLRQSEEQLLNSCHPKTRYNIGLAEKKNVTVREGNTNADFEIFWQLLNKTHSKQKVSTHPKNYYQKILNLRTTDYGLRTYLYIAEHDSAPLAANLVYWYGTIATYVHGGSDYQYRGLMAPHLLQWRQMQDAKKAGLHHYDFWGYNEARWPGVSRFKSGFNGKIVQYPGTFDLPIQKNWYRLYTIIQHLRKI